MERVANLAAEEQPLLGGLGAALGGLWTTWQGLDPSLRALVAFAVAAFFLGFAAPRLLPLLQRLGDALPGGDGRLLGTATRTLSDHSAGRRRVPEPAADLLRVGVSLLTGGSVPAALASLGLEALREHPAAVEAARDPAQATLRAGRALAASKTPHPRDVSATRSLLSDLAAGGAPPVLVPAVRDSGPRPGFAWLAPRDEGLTLDIRARRRGRVVAELQVRIPPVPGEPAPETDGG